MRSLINEAYETAKSCLTDHRDQLEKLTEALLEKETLSIAEINDLLGLNPPPAPEEAEEEAAVPADEAISSGDDHADA